jgi:hypothetical protein
LSAAADVVEKKLASLSETLRSRTRDVGPNIASKDLHVSCLWVIGSHHAVPSVPYCTPALWPSFAHTPNHATHLHHVDHLLHSDPRQR